MSINVGQQASDFLVRDWLMMLMMSSTNGGFERRKNRLVLLDEFQGFYIRRPSRSILCPLRARARGHKLPPKSLNSIVIYGDHAHLSKGEG